LHLPYFIEGEDIKDLLHVRDAAQVFNVFVSRKMPAMHCYGDKKENKNLLK